MPQALTFYIDIDLRSSRIFLAPFQQSKEAPYVIECKSRWTAEELLKKLHAGLIQNPMESPQNYRLVEILNHPLGKLKILELKGVEGS